MFLFKFKILILYFVSSFVSAECPNSTAEVFQSDNNFVIQANDASIGTIDDASPCQLIGDCEIVCFPNGGQESEYQAAIQSLYDENPVCHSDGIRLIVPKQAICSTCTNLTMNWLPLEITIKDLDIDLTDVTQINANAFNSTPFSEIKNLTLRNAKLTANIYNLTFNGLLSLEQLVMTNHTFDSSSYIHDGLLDLVSESLTSFTLIERMEQGGNGIGIPLNGIFGDKSKSLPNVVYVKLQYKPMYIDPGSFSALPNLKELDLSDSHLSHKDFLDEFAFSFVKLKILNLERNQLTELPATIFNVFFEPISAEDSSLPIILLSGNPWNCACELEDLQLLMKNFLNFEGEILCDTPEIIHNYPIRETEFCPYPVTTPTATSTTRASTSTISTTTTTESISSSAKLTPTISIVLAACSIIATIVGM